MEASDKIGVTKVHVTVLDEVGTVLEKGAATRAGENWWEFPSQTQGKTVIAEAWDLPEHVTKVVT